jgi:hypothetical protein
MKLTDQRPIVRGTGRRVTLARSLDSVGGLSRRLPRWHLFDGRRSRVLRRVNPAGSTDTEDLMRLDSDKG